MKNTEKRKCPRVEVHYPISYVCMDENGCEVQEKMGVALNICQSGILIETADSIFSKYISLISVDFKQNMIETRGKVVYCKRDKSGKHRTGIRFEGTDAQKINFVRGLIKSYHYKKKENRWSSSSEGKTAVM